MILYTNKLNCNNGHRFVGNITIELSQYNNNTGNNIQYYGIIFCEKLDENNTKKYISIIADYPKSIRNQHINNRNMAWWQLANRSGNWYRILICCWTNAIHVEM